MGPSTSLSGTVGATTLTVEQMASHTHPVPLLVKSDGAGANISRTIKGEGVTTGATGGSQSHTHSLSGASGAASGLPPYYALAYVMRIA